MNKTQKGITLIALIITIVVLLILAVVTINAVNEGSIFAHAENATKRYNISAEEEAIKLALAEWNMEKYYSKENTQTFLSYMQGRLIEIINSGTDITENENGVLTVNTKSGNTFIVSQDGTVTLSNGGSTGGGGTTPQDNPPDEPVVETSWTYDEGTKTYTKGDLSITADSNGYLSNADILTALGIENSTGTYTGNWEVIGNSNGKLKLVSVSNVGPTVTLGYQDEVANTAKTTEEYDSMTDSEKMERGLASYQRAMTTLKEAVVTATGITSAESIDLQDIYDIIGEENVDKTTNNPNYGKIYNLYYDVAAGEVKSKYSTDGGTSWSSPSETSYTSKTFVNANGAKIVVDSEGDEVTLTDDYIYYTLTAEQKTAVGSLASGVYWLSSLCVNCDSSYVDFNVRDMGSGNLNAYDLFDSYGNVYYDSRRSPCRSFNLRCKI